MSPVSAMILSAFGALWVVLAIYSQRSPLPILCVIPVVIAAGLIGWSISVARSVTPPDPRDRKRLNKIVAYASCFEGVAIFLGANILDYMGVSHQILPLIAVVVGLHFLPFARFVPDWRYYPIALLLVAIGIVGAAVQPPDLRAWFVGLSSALVLWTAAVIALRTGVPAR
jgi:ABC-type transport system involved in multi-copper enzyme maturation permease subunit